MAEKILKGIKFPGLEDTYIIPEGLSSEDEIIDSPVPFDADTLNGRDASYFDNQIAVERARIDNLTSLDEGSTTGDAELADIRVGYDGTTYDSAGDAVRGQAETAIRYTEQTLTTEQQAQARENIGAADKTEVDSLDSTLLERINPCVLTLDSVFYDGRIVASTGEFIATSTNGRRRASDFIELETNVVYQCDCERIYENNVMNYPDVIAIYNADKTFLRYIANPVDFANIVLMGDEKYLRLSVVADTLNVLRIYPKDVGYEETVTLNPNLKIPQLDELPVNPDDDSLGDILLERVSPCVMDMDTEFAHGHLDYDTGNFIEQTGSTRRTSDFIELEEGVVYQCDIEYVNSSGNLQTYASVGYYNTDKTFSRWASMPSDITNIKLNNNEKYIRMWFNAQQLNLLRMYPKHVGYEPKVVLNSNLKVPQVDSLSMIPYIHARRPVIAFIFDGDYDRNANMEAIFSRHNMRVGFAPQYNIAFTNNSVETYLSWQEKGHEILAHGYYVLVGDTYTEEQGKQYIKASYKTLKGYGFDIHGFIGSHGKVDEKYLPTLKRYYDYAATENNHTSGGTITESCLFFGTDSPYNLWRYSIQRSPLDKAIEAVDRVMETGGLLLLMGHADSKDIDQLTDENVESLLTYIEEVGATVKTPYEAIKDYYAIRYEDIIN